MITKAFTIYDNKTLAYLPPFFSQTTASAVRMFTDTCSAPDNQFARHSSDYVLYEIGTYDDSNGSFSSLDPHVNLGLAADFLPETPQSTLFPEPSE